MFAKPMWTGSLAECCGRDCEFTSTISQRSVNSGGLMCSVDINCWLRSLFTRVAGCAHTGVAGCLHTGVCGCRLDWCVWLQAWAASSSRSQSRRRLCREARWQRPRIVQTKDQTIQ